VFILFEIINSNAKIIGSSGIEFVLIGVIINTALIIYTHALPNR